MNYVSTTSMADAIYKRLKLNTYNKREYRAMRGSFYNWMREAGLGSQPYTLRAMFGRFCASEFVMNEGIPENPKNPIILDVYAIRAACEPGFIEQGEGVGDIYIPDTVYKDVPIKGAN